MADDAGLSITPLTAAVGASVTGIDLATGVAAEEMHTIRGALLDHLVVVIPGQNLSPEAQIVFTEGLGPVEPHPLGVRPGADPDGRCIVLENRPGLRGARNDFWHSDISCAERPPGVSLLHAVTVPEGRGDTLFCNMYRAWELLSPGLQAMIRPLTADHSGEALRQRNLQAESDSSSEISVPAPSRHPVVRRHPETGRPALFTNTFFTTNFTDMSVADSRPLLDHLEAVATRPDNVYRHRWQAGDVVMWDNRCTMHFAEYDYEPGESRRMHRTTAAGERPLAATP